MSSHLKTDALISIRDGAAAVEEGETLIIILCGHSDIEGKFLIGNGEGVCRQLTKDELEASVRTCKGKVMVITTACHGGLGTNNLWDLVAAAPTSQESSSIVASESNQHYGGVFTGALPAEHYSQAGIDMPRPGARTITEFYPEPHNTDDLVSEMNKFRLSLNRHLYRAPFGHRGDRDHMFPFDGPTSLSAIPFTKVTPNPVTSTSVGQSGSRERTMDVGGDEQEMLELATAVKREELATVVSNIFVMRPKKHWSHLRKHEALRKQARMDLLMGCLSKRLRDVGKCDVNVVTFEGKWLEPAYWLARLWKAAGGVAVDQSAWAKTVSAATSTVDVR
ncbi:uncharacterized protein EV420DRAFT_1641789 [Desarmillaria tabescens]|uniref:Uncharacterized protein n=1 Tax=Armillaria tabescens TaxID=1929756 RepID=A0AA39KEB4_ARMTA|nr:uncharacterized protein EV420DRAFT_1641789 [Desarmillaria tabescens]KAK0459584.1 hypothetical protein EV420DRAFT_1641789 [Desarmillaria tabescens]